MKKSRRYLLILTALIAALLLCVTACSKTAGTADEGTVKEVTLDVVQADGASTHYEASTQQEYLKGLLDEIAETGDFSYEESAGLITTVNDERADFNKDNAYWAIFVNDEYGQYGMNEQPVSDGDAFRLEYTPADSEF